MSRQFRTLPAASSVALVAATRTSSTELTIPNYGITDVSAAAATDWVLAPPDVGVRKTLFSTSSTSVARVVRLSTGTSVVGNSTAGTIITFQATLDTVITLIGINSTRWIVESVYPPAAAVNSTGLTVATS